MSPEDEARLRQQRRSNALLASLARQIQGPPDPNMHIMDNVAVSRGEQR